MNDATNPAYYKRAPFQTIDVIKAWGLGFALGNTVKYISRAGYKDPAKKLEDLKKARWYLDWEIRQLEGNPAAERVDSIKLVREFHESFGQAVADAPLVTEKPLNALRLRLLSEELKELSDALIAGDTVETLDALVDLQYVLDGAFLALGFHAVKDAALAEVHRSNMSKLDADGKPVMREDGKILKGPNYSPPNLVPIIAGAFGGVIP